MAWGRFKTFIREYLTFQWMNRFQDDVYGKLNYLNDNKINSSMIASSAQPNKLIKTNSEGKIVADIIGHATTAENGVPAGIIAYFPAELIPAGWLECDGRAISRETYSVLFAVIGTIYGPGDSATTFNIPDLRGEFVRGWSHGRADVDEDRELGSFQTDEFKKHKHPWLWGLDSDDSGNGTCEPEYTRKPGRVDDAMGEVGGDETRPRNVALVPCICCGIGVGTNGTPVNYSILQGFQTDVIKPITDSENAIRIMSVDNSKTLMVFNTVDNKIIFGASIEEIEIAALGGRL